MEIKICFLIRQLNEGGAQRQLYELVKRLDKKKFNVTVITFYQGGSFCSFFSRIENIRLVCLEKAGRFDLFGFVFRLAAQLRKLDPKVVHGYLIGGNLFGLVAKCVVPGVRLIWGIRSSASGSQLIKWDRKLQYLERLTSRWVDAIIVNSQAGWNNCVTMGYPKEKLEIIPNGIDLKIFKPDVKFRDEIRNSFGWHEKIFVIGFVGRLAPVKNIPLLLHAAKAMLSLRNDFMLVLVGGGSVEYLDSLKKLSHFLGLEENVVWAGSRQDVHRFFPALDVLTLLSEVEGFPNVLAEAMACGVPCVSTVVGDAVDIVGSCGRIIKTGNEDDILAAWIDILDHRDRYPSSSMRARIQERYSMEILLERTERLLVVNS